MCRVQRVSRRTHGPVPVPVAAHTGHGHRRATGTATADTASHDVYILCIRVTVYAFSALIFAYKLYIEYRVSPRPRGATARESSPVSREQLRPRPAGGAPPRRRRRHSARSRTTSVRATSRRSRRRRVVRGPARSRLACRGAQASGDAGHGHRLPARIAARMSLGTSIAQVRAAALISVADDGARRGHRRVPARVHGGSPPPPRSGTTQQASLAVVGPETDD